MLHFFESLEERLSRGAPTHIDLHNVDNVSGDALMYLLALLDIWDESDRPARVRGNLPSNEIARSAILAAGFQRFVAGLPRGIKGDPNTLQIVSDSKIQPKVAHDLLEFAVQRLSLQRGETTRGAYSVLIESMSNVVEHAYADNVSFERKWWAMAQCDAERREVRMTIVDYGEGIAATMRKTALERIGHNFSMLRDSQLVVSAMQGQYRRSRTRQVWRGRGLPQIRQVYKEGAIRNLTIVSSSAYIEGDSGRDLSVPLQGTIISFTLVSDRSKTSHED